MHCGIHTEVLEIEEIVACMHSVLACVKKKKKKKNGNASENCQYRRAWVFEIED